MIKEKQMKQFEISTDSNCDLYFDEIKQMGIYVGHLNYTLDNGKEFLDLKDEFTEYSQYVDFYNKLRKGYVAKTSILSLQAHVDLFTEMAKNGVKTALHIAQSKGLSPTIDNANQAIEIVKEKYPDINYVAIQSNTTTMGEGMLVRVATKMRDEGKSLEETKNYIESIKNHVQHIVMVDDLLYLKRGGRIGAAQAVFGTMLGVKPIIEFNMAGKLEIVRKERGTKKAFMSILNEFKSHTLNKDFPYAVIVHTDNTKDATELQKLVEEQTGVKPELRIMGPIIGAHVGPNAVALAFISNEDRPQ